MEGEGGDGRFVTVGARDWETGAMHSVGVASVSRVTECFAARLKLEHAGDRVHSAAAR